MDVHLKKYGNFTLAYTIISDKGRGLHHFKTEEGLIGYGVHKNLRLMLGDPLCSQENIKSLVEDFLDDSKRNEKKVVGVQSGSNTANVFSEYGFDATHMGVETILNVQDFDLKGKKKTKLRRWINTAKNAGIHVVEDTFNNCDCLEDTMKISEDWFNSKINKNELALMTRKEKFEDEEDTRKFFAYNNESLVGYIVFDPIYENEEIAGYYADICRTNPRSPNGTIDLIIDEARKSFQKEDIKKLSLGISPLAETNNEHKLNNSLMHFILRSNYYFGNKMYSFKGLEFHKKAYHDGVQTYREPKFYITKGKAPVFDLLNTFSYIGIIPNNGFLGSVGYVASCMSSEFYDLIKKQASKLSLIKKEDNSTKNL